MYYIKMTVLFIIVLHVFNYVAESFAFPNDVVTVHRSGFRGRIRQRMMG